MSTVFHTVTWIENATGITMSLGLEGTIATREDAERVADAYRELMLVGIEVDDAFQARVGILEITAPDPRLKHPTPLTNVDDVVAGLQARIATKRKAAIKLPCQDPACKLDSPHAGPCDRELYTR